MGILAPARGSYREDLCQSASEAIARRGTPPAPIDLLNVKAQPTRERRLSFRCIPCGLRLSRSCRQSIRDYVLPNISAVMLRPQLCGVAAASPARRRPLSFPMQHKSTTLGRHSVKEVGSCSRSYS